MSFDKEIDKGKENAFMKTRILVAVVGLPLLLAVLLLGPVWILGIVVGAIAACSAWELVCCTEKEIKPRMVCYVAVCAYIIPLFSVVFDPGKVYSVMLFLLFALLFGELMLSFHMGQPMKLETVTAALLAGGVMPVLLSSIVKLALLDNGRVYVLLPFIAAFVSDSGAYFIGIFFGKHKLTPQLSPNKTIEGSAGGFVCAIAAMIVYGLILRAMDYEVNLAVMGVYGFLGSMACQLGDLSFSAVKRLCGVKDYGNLIPGHGGMLDRFDSMFWTAAMLEILVSWVPAIV